MISGEFRLKLKSQDELILPNQFTIIGMQQVMKAAFWDEALDWYVGLCAHNPTDSLALASINEPGATNGYTRQTIPGDVTNWPTIAQINGESYIETRDFTFPATGDYDLAVNRMFITDGASVIAISSVIPEGLSIIDAPYEANYRLWFR